MIRTKEFVLAPELKKVWKNAIAPVAKAALADFRTWPLYQHVGEPWPEAPPRFLRAASLSVVGKGVKSSATQALEQAANPGLKAMYMNLSTLLNVRNHFFCEEVWDRPQEVIWRATEKALAGLSKRLKWKPSDQEKGFWLYSPNTHLWQYVWEQLHPQAVEAPFQEHFLTIFRAGHIPAGLRGKDWKTCRFLYF
jgi:hypothetical protein